MVEKVLVCGAGMVGVSIALELQRRGMDVTLLDRREPGLETSHGNAGIITRTSLVPINNPTLWRQLPKLLLNQSASFRYNVTFMLRNMRWATGFITRARKGPCEKTAKALFDLIELSRGEHQRLICEAGAQHMFHDDGWLFLYRNQADFENADFLRSAYSRYGIEMADMSENDIADLEPGLKPVFRKGVWIKDTRSVRDPSSLVQSYARLFTDRGGIIRTCELATIANQDGWQATDREGNHLKADKMVIALGPWSKDFLARFGFSGSRWDMSGAIICSIRALQATRTAR